ncbi:ShlB/FhaC/HecB family hemolysin secretion/activation protein [Alkalilimnicola sp. S0819]|nr:ShlB/FhaC/HecB family hemolysin secretion/activation protein [Alkalilimnicola sp. S0819]MPQ15407.1 BamA/TamA family outer membrane protein [Alkalilimnicola sp. S0819]
MTFTRQAALCALALAAAAPALGQTPPDAGQVYQQMQPDTAAPLAPSVDIDLRGEPLRDRKAGGARARITRIDFQGNALYSDAELLTALGDVLGKAYDLAGLQALANRVSRHYREHGYPFARAVLPAQSLDDGRLRLDIIEGHYGEVAASGEPRLASAVQAYLRPLKAGEPIASDALERTLLIAGDLPGVRLTPVMRPGERHGTGDLDVRVAAAPRVSGEVALDNHGSRYSGEYRARGRLAVNRVLMVGDEASLTALYTSEDTWFGDIRYSLPLGSSGLRGSVAYAHTDYQLGKGFEGYTGTAKIGSLGLSYPLIRRQQANFLLTAAWQHKDLDDTAEDILYDKAATSQSLPLGLRFDVRDGLAGGGVSYGGLVITPVQFESRQTGLADADYGLTKVNLELARLQALGGGLTLFGRFSGQWADREVIDGSESFYLGGPDGVRAYPVGEGSDSRGWLAQLELRYRAPRGLEPFLFFDAGRTPGGGVNRDERRNISGGGLGLRYGIGALQLELSSAWAVDGGDALSDDKQRTPRVWGSIAYGF